MSDWGNIASNLAGQVGGYFADQQARNNQNHENRMSQSRNIQMQKEFAQHGLRWKIEDAKRAGISPIAALGASGASFSPVSVGHSSDYSKGDALRSMGQDVGRAISAASTRQEREHSDLMRVEQLKNARLQNQVLESQVIGLQNRASNPPLPSPLPGALLEGQGNSSRKGSYVTEQPLERTRSAPGHDNQDPGYVSDVGWARTSTGLTPVPSKDVKERIEDQIIPETMWSIRNQLSPNFGGADRPPRYLLPKGADQWEWSVWSQEWQPRYGYRKNFVDRIFDRSDSFRNQSRSFRKGG